MHPIFQTIFWLQKEVYIIRREQSKCQNTKNLKPMLERDTRFISAVNAIAILVVNTISGEGLWTILAFDQIWLKILDICEQEGDCYAKCSLNQTGRSLGLDGSQNWKERPRGWTPRRMEGEEEAEIVMKRRKQQERGSSHDWCLESIEGRCLSNG